MVFRTKYTYETPKSIEDFQTLVQGIFEVALEFENKANSTEDPGDKDELHYRAALLTGAANTIMNLKLEIVALRTGS